MEPSQRTGQKAAQTFVIKRKREKASVVLGLSRISLFGCKRQENRNTCKPGDTVPFMKYGGGRVILWRSFAAPIQLDQES